MLGYSFRITQPARRASPPGLVAEDGWTLRATSQPGHVMSVQRAGFDAGGGAAVHADSVIAAAPVRRGYPDHAQLVPGTLALSEFIYAGDSVTGAANASAVTSPKPIAAWAMPDRQLVGNMVHWEIAAFHRDARPDAAGVGRQVACVQVRANNGTTATAWQTVSATAISTIVEDANPVPVYRGDIDITALATGAFWLEAKVFPWFGTAASVLSSEDGTTIRGFSRRRFYKDVARAASPPLAYVSASGNDATGVWSTNAATAAATPFATVTGAQTAIYTQSGVTGGDASGCRIRVGAGTFVLVSPNSAIKQPQTLATMVIERDPAATRATAIVTMGAAAWRPNLGVNSAGTATSFVGGATEALVTLSDITFRRTGTQVISPTSSGGIACNLALRFHNVAFDNASFTGVMRGTGTHLALWGCVISNYAGNLLAFNTSGEIRMLRGVVASMANQPYEAFCTLGCTLTNPGGASVSEPAKGAIWAYNKLLSPVTTNNSIRVAGGAGDAAISQFAVVQNLVEYTSAVSNPAVWISADDSASSTDHVVIHHNTTTGTDSSGRWNLFYDESPGTTRRSHTRYSFKGNIACQFNTKGDIFSGVTEGNPDARNRIGQLAFVHGVACAGNYSVYADASGISGTDSFRQVYGGAGTRIANGDPLYTDYKGTGGVYGAAVAGAGGGTYTLQAGSPARAILSKPLLAFDLAGAARGVAAQAAGAYR